MIRFYKEGQKRLSKSRTIKVSQDAVLPAMIVHLPTSELATQLLIDPQALDNERYPGIYDAEGDYVPQYCDNPEKIPQGRLEPNPSESPQATA